MWARLSRRAGSCTAMTSAGAEALDTEYLTISPGCLNMNSFCAIPWLISTSRQSSMFSHFAPCMSCPQHFSIPSMVQYFTHRRSVNDRQVEARMPYHAFADFLLAVEGHILHI